MQRQQARPVAREISWLRLRGSKAQCPTRQTSSEDSHGTSTTIPTVHLLRSRTRQTSVYKLRPTAKWPLGLTSWSEHRHPASLHRVLAVETARQRRPPLSR